MTTPPLLTPVDYQTYVRVSPQFDFSELQAYETQIYEGWLSAILGPHLGAYRTWLNLMPADNSLSAQIHPHVVPFLVYAVWSAFILEGNAIATRSGVVEKENEYSNPLDPAQRGALARRYENLANTYATRITGLLPGNACATNQPVTSLQVGSVKPPNRSKFP